MLKSTFMSDFLNISERITTISKQIEAEDAKKTPKQLALDKAAMESVGKAGMYDGIVHLAPGTAEEMNNEEREAEERLRQQKERERDAMAANRPLAVKDVRIVRT